MEKDFENVEFVSKMMKYLSWALINMQYQVGSENYDIIIDPWSLARELLYRAGTPFLRTNTYISQVHNGNERKVWIHCRVGNTIRSQSPAEQDVQSLHAP